MKRVHDFRYRVKKQETITIEVTPVNFESSLSSVEAVLDGKELENIGTSENPVYQFKVKKTVGKTHLVIMEFSFLPDSPDEAFYEVTISGEADVGCPCGFEIAKTDNDKSPDINFRVVE